MTDNAPAPSTPPRVTAAAEVLPDGRRVYKTKRARQKAFLRVFPRRGTIMGAAAAAGVDRQTVRTWRLTDPWFAEEFRKCELDVTELLEDSAVRDAVRGDASTRQFLLKARKPSVYTEKMRLEHGIDGTTIGGLVSMLVGLLRRLIPDACPHCKTNLALKPVIARELVAMSARLGKADQTPSTDDAATTPAEAAAP